MSKLEEIFQKIQSYPNGEAVAKRLTQLWDVAIVDNDSSIPERVMEVIESYEEKLLQRSQLDMVTEKAVLPIFRQALKDSIDEEWAEFKNSHEIKPLEKLDRQRLFADASGLVRGTGFEDWVLGKEVESASTESQLLVHRIIHESSKEKKV